MLRIAALAGFFCAATPISGNADVAEIATDVFRSYKACFDIRDDDEPRLECYDAMSPQIVNMADSIAEVVSKSCEIEDWNYEAMGSHMVIRGAATCAEGRMDYRLYDGEAFITSGTTFIRGFAFETIASVSPIPAAMQIKYVIE